MDSEAELRANYLLGALPALVLERAAPRLVVLDVRRGQILHQADEPRDRVTLPLSAVLSIVAPDPSGNNVSVGLVGREGAVGLTAALASVEPRVDVACVIAGRVVSLSNEDFFALFEDFRAFRRAVIQYLSTQLLDVVQVATCNRIHSLEQRLASWLLILRDRSGRAEFPITHEGMAVLLGASRPKVSTALEALKRRGLVAKDRGLVRIVDAAGLEMGTGGCYAIIRDATRRRAASLDIDFEAPAELPEGDPVERDLAAAGV
jgi:CRP-like cAMP-binding protein